MLVSANGAYQAVAMKALRAGSEKSKSEFLNEAEILKQINHLNVVRLIGVCSKNEPYCIIFELEEKNDLLKFLRSQEGLKLDVNKKTLICHQVSYIMIA